MDRFAARQQTTRAEAIRRLLVEAFQRQEELIEELFAPRPGRRRRPVRRPQAAVQRELEELREIAADRSEDPWP